MQVLRASIVSLVIVCSGCGGEAAAPTPAANDLQSPSWWLRQASEAAGQVDRNSLDDLPMILLRLQVQAGDMEAAEEAAARLKAEWKGEELEFTSRMVEVYTEAGRIEAALEIAEKAARVAPPEGQRRVASMLVEIARQQANEGDFSEAKALANSISEPDYRGRALAAIAYAQAEEDLEAALEILQSAAAVEEVSVLALGRKAREANRWDLFSDIVQTALKQAKAASFAAQGRIYRNIGQMLAETDQEKLDAELVEQVRKSVVDYAQTPQPEGVRQHEYERGFKAAGWALVSLKMYDGLPPIMEKVSDHSASALNMQLAVDLAEEGRYDEAREAARRDTHVRLAFRKVAVAQAKRGDFEAAKQTAALCRGQEEQNSAYREIAVMQAQQGEFSATMETLEAIKPVRGRGHVLATATYHKVSVLVTVAREQVEAGEQDAARESLDQALVIARSADDAAERYKLTTAVVRGLAEAGDFQRARELAEGIGNAEMLIQLAEEHVVEGREQEFEHALQAAQEHTTSDLGREGTGVSHHARIAALLLRVGRPEAAEQTIHELLEGAGPMEPSIFKLLAYATAGSFYAHTDQLGELWQYVAAMHEPLERAYITTAVALALLEPERWGSAWSNRGENP